MRHHPKPKRQSIIIAEILCLMIFAAFLAVLRLQSFATEAIAVYDYAHPTVMQLFISPLDEPIDWRPPDTIFIQDTVWGSLAHPTALRKKSASIYEVDCIKILELHLDGDVLNVIVKNNPRNIESSFAVSLYNPNLPHVLDSLRRIGFQPNTYQFIYFATVSDETVYQNWITLLDRIVQSMIRVRFYEERIYCDKYSIAYGEKLLPRIKVIKSKDATKDHKEYLDQRKFQGIQCGLRSMSLYLPPPPKPSIPMIFLDYLNPFGEDYLHTKRWWLNET